MLGRAHLFPVLLSAVTRPQGTGSDFATRCLQPDFTPTGVGDDSYHTSSSRAVGAQDNLGWKRPLEVFNEASYWKQVWPDQVAQGLDQSKCLGSWVSPVMPLGKPCWGCMLWSQHWETTSVPPVQTWSVFLSQVPPWQSSCVKGLLCNWSLMAWAFKGLSVSVSWSPNTTTPLPSDSLPELCPGCSQTGSVLSSI